MDLLEHAAGVWARKYVVLGVAILVAIGVYGWRSNAPEQYDATTTLQVRLPDTQSSDPSGAVAFYAQSVGGLVDSRERHRGGPRRGRGAPRASTTSASPRRSPASPAS